MNQMNQMNQKPPEKKATMSLIFGVVSAIIPVIATIFFRSQGLSSLTSKGPITVVILLSLVGVGAAIVGMMMATAASRELKMANKPASAAVAGLVLCIIGCTWNFGCVACSVIACI
ncbi:MAG: hypothetical protein FWG31_07575 [Oscillospiraceae bacterium]|nr:hypothetical protein [Oscillospiraceae bacterium]